MPLSTLFEGILNTASTSTGIYRDSRTHTQTFSKGPFDVIIWKVGCLKPNNSSRPYNLHLRFSVFDHKLSRKHEKRTTLDPHRHLEKPRGCERESEIENPVGAYPLCRAEAIRFTEAIARKSAYDIHRDAYAEYRPFELSYQFPAGEYYFFFLEEEGVQTNPTECENSAEGT